MEINIGITGGGTPISLNVELTEEQLTQAVEAALAGGGVLTLRGTDGTLVMVPPAALGYIRTAQNDRQRVGFGFA
ncbi:DUF3107 domain-containing protein [Arcanobacterium sp. S3PF19]|uniref:DUF3107 domain-containing protein n=1 Tax=Arcanobacterium sp. S3PF19 TaxID=1219585 RepID=UPI00050F15E8|nr:DUF3107 domain-containing protein [Arcanobacterium sp. S3PF19]KGF06063.1 hypothetical protein HMPREF1631_04550 [Arcanobacterium sp. S3PF19]